MIEIRNYSANDTELLWDLFFNTIRQINSRDYTKEQVEAWASDSVDPDLWRKRMEGINPFIAEIDGVIAGYTDLQPSGLIDHFFCHHKYQRKGVGSALMNHVFAKGRERAINRFHSEVSITARPFYEHFGFSVVNEQQMEVRGQVLTNYLMEKNNQKQTI